MQRLDLCFSDRLLKPNGGTEEHLSVNDPCKLSELLKNWFNSAVKLNYVSINCDIYSGLKDITPAS